MTVVTLQPEELLDNLPSLGSPPLVYRRLVEVIEDEPRIACSAP